LEIGNKDNNVEFDLWYANSYDFVKYELNKIEKVYEQLAEYADFEPRIYTYSCVDCSQELKREFCIS
jgi:hypothetical protein